MTKQDIIERAKRVSFSSNPKDYIDFVGELAKENEPVPADVQEAAENSEIILTTDGELTIYSFVGAPRWWATIREAEEALSVFKAGAKYERERLMKEAVD